MAAWNEGATKVRTFDNRWNLPEVLHLLIALEPLTKDCLAVNDSIAREEESIVAMRCVGDVLKSGGSNSK
jgi:hypothetical protein